MIYMRESLEIIIVIYRMKNKLLKLQTVQRVIWFTTRHSSSHVSCWSTQHLIANM